MPDSPQTVSLRAGVATAEARVTVFICVNCARAGVAPPARSGRPTLPAIPWPVSTKQVVVPCAGRIQPEHLLKAFEAGAEMVCVVACEEANCHYLEGSCRAARRCEYVGDLMDQIGLGRERLALFHLPGSAQQDMAVGMAADPSGKVASPDEDLARCLASLAEGVAQRLRKLPPNPMHQPQATEATDEVEVSETEETEESDG